MPYYPAASVCFAGTLLGAGRWSQARLVGLVARRPRRARRAAASRGVRAGLPGYGGFQSKPDLVMMGSLLGLRKTRPQTP